MKLRNIMRMILAGAAIAWMALSALPASAAGIDAGVSQFKYAVFDDATPADPSAAPADPSADPAPAPDAPAPDAPDAPAPQ